ncbi:MAG: AAA family ATPase [Brevundimonas sp.]|uniref:AAA family ATPase n=1 Tax=Brevundimonas sp. TaxID=1871086 RepID=UPI004034019B
MIEGFDEASFSAELPLYFTPAKPISRPEHLYGRDAKLRAISRALGSPGKHIFIYGDRGVGKTSLAKTAFQLHRPACEDAPIIVCENDSKFFELVDAMRRQLVLTGQAAQVGQRSSHAFQTDPMQNSGLELPTLRNMNDVVEVLRSIAPKSGQPAVVIVDEFDQLPGDSEKKNFADLIKQLSDQDVNIRLIICGIGRSLEELIGTHLSTDRYLAAVSLDQIPHDSRWKIIEAACERFDVKIDRDSIIRIGQISDGFPYYIHLMGEKIFWQVFDDHENVKIVSKDHYKMGIQSAIEESQTSLKQAYELATQKHKLSEDYQDVLWSVADGTLMSRQVSDIFQNSYLEIMDSMNSRKALSKEAFYQRMNKLKTESHGRIIVGNQQGWYGFRENVVRGYVRLRAERAGVKIGIDHIRG